VLLGGKHALTGLEMRDILGMSLMV
jgi:hypothetical protein